MDTHISGQEKETFPTLKIKSKWDNNNNNNFHYHHSLNVDQMPSPVLSVGIISFIHHNNCVILCSHHFIDGEIKSQRGEITYPRSMKDNK